MKLPPLRLILTAVALAFALYWAILGSVWLSRWTLGLPNLERRVERLEAIWAADAIMRAQQEIEAADAAEAALETLK